MAILLRKVEETSVLIRINAELDKYLPAEYRQPNENQMILRNITRNYSGEITKTMIEVEVYNFYNL